VWPDSENFFVHLETRIAKLAKRWTGWPDECVKILPKVYVAQYIFCQNYCITLSVEKVAQKHINTRPLGGRIWSPWWEIVVYTFLSIFKNEKKIYAEMFPRGEKIGWFWSFFKKYGHAAYCHKTSQNELLMVLCHCYVVENIF
jgi:hypothetical protein